MRKWMLPLGVALSYTASPRHAQVYTPTNLGDCIDIMAWNSQLLLGQLASHTKGRYYGSPSRLDPVSLSIYVEPYSCDADAPSYSGAPKTTGILAHELGHFAAGIPNVTPPLTKTEYVERLCVWEAQVASNNLKASSEIYQATAGYLDVPLIAQNASVIEPLIAGNSPLIDIGNAFCDGNTNSSGKTYRKFYEDDYDARYPW